MTESDEDFNESPPLDEERLKKQSEKHPKIDVIHDGNIIEINELPDRELYEVECPELWIKEKIGHERFSCQVSLKEIFAFIDIINNIAINEYFLRFSLNIKRISIE